MEDGNRGWRIEDVLHWRVASGVALAMGAIRGHRWRVLVAPVTFMSVVELARIGSSGPTVDAPASLAVMHPSAFLVGRSRAASAATDRAERTTNPYHTR